MNTHINLNKNKKYAIFLVGGSGTGKTTTERQIVDSGLGRSIVSFATRDKREGEINHTHYHFVSVPDFNLLSIINRIEISPEWLYGITEEELLSGDKKLNIYSVINIKPVAQSIDYINENNLDIIPIIIFFNIDETIRTKMMIDRGEKEEDILIRLGREDKLSDLAKVGLKADYVVEEMNDSMQDNIIDFLCQL